MAGWLRGVVKEVVSGDTVVVAASARPGQIPPEKRLTLSSVMAPKLGRRDGSTRDEPFAWESREFLRKLAVGKPCVFKVDYVLEQAGNREFGSVFINDKENVAVSLIAAGLAKVRPSGAQQSPFYEDMVKAQDNAESRGVGVHTKDAAALAGTVRDTQTADEFDAAGYAQRLGKGKPVQAIVEAVISGSLLRSTLLPELQPASVMLVGVQCPSMGRRPTPGAAAEGAAADGAAAEAPAAAQPEPFAREARHFSESRCLNKDVRIVVEGVNQYGVLVGSLLYPAPPAAPADKPSTSSGGADGEAAAPAAPAAAEGPAMEDLGSGLVKAGLAKTSEWGLNMMTSGSFKLRESERAAKTARTGMWHNYVPQTGNSAKLSDKFSGVVVEVVSGDCLAVKDRASGVERRVNLSSMRTPRMGTRDRAPDPWAAEAKEFLRQRLVGREVSVSMEYDRKVQIGGPEAVARPGAGEERIMSFATVTVEEQQKVNNVAELLLVRGLGQVVRHRGDEERSARYEDLMNAEEQGKKNKKGMWSSKEAPVPRVNDLSLPGSGARAKAHLSSLQRTGKLAGVCEYVLSGHRVKVHIPKDSVTIAFSPSGVRCPQRPQAAGPGRPAVEAEPYWEEATAYTREHVLQRDVEVEVDGVDKAGTFMGTLRCGKLNLGVGLLESGLAKLHPSFDPDRVKGGQDLVAAQQKARAAKLKVWEKDEPAPAPAQGEGEAAEGGEAAAAANGSSGGQHERVSVQVTDVQDANSMYVQMADEPRVGWVAEQLAELNLEASPTLQAPLRAGDKCLAQSSADKQWYRGTVEKAFTADPTAPRYDVHFMDFGNKETLAAGAVRAMQPALAAVPAQAYPAALAFIKAPPVDADFGEEAARALWDLVGGSRPMVAYVERRERLQAAGKQWGVQAPTKLHLTLMVEGSEEYAHSVNGQLLAGGLARLVEPKGPQGASAEVLEALRGCEEQARKRHVGMWVHGDPGSEDENDDAGFPALGGKRGGKR